MTRRMFGSEIVTSDAFLDMPASTQALYFQLGMDADDDGFVNPRRIMRMISAGEDDLKILLAKRFLLPFETGVVVIKHWLIYNTIRKDRYKETRYLDEKATLRIKRNMAYTDGSDGVPLELTNGEEIKKPLWIENREKAMKESDLPYSFVSKITRAFLGKPCPMPDCGVEMRNYPMSKNHWPSIQHNVPISKGGKHEVGNISVICTICNTSNGNKETGELNSKEVMEVWRQIGTDRLPQVKLNQVKLITATEVADPPKADAFFQKRKNERKDEGEAMGLKEFVLMCRGSMFGHIRLIGEYADEKESEFTTRGQWREFGRRNLRVARQLAPYTERQRSDAMEKMEKDLKENGGFISKWTLETLQKYLD